MTSLPHNDRIKLIREYLERIAPEQDLETPFDRLQNAQEQLEASFRSADEDDGPNETLEVKRSYGDDQEAMETLDVVVREGVNADVTPEKITQLEAVIHKRGRPAITIFNNSYRSPAGEWRHLGQPEIKQRLEGVIPSVGCIEIPNDPRGRPYAGTGFVVGKDLLMTNRHVAELFALGRGQRNLRFLPGRTAAVDFQREIPHELLDEPVLLTVTDIRMIHPYWDMALLEVQGLPDQHGQLQLSTTHPENMIRDEVVVIGYPAEDSRSNAEVQNDIFKGYFEVKRMLPGRLNGRLDYTNKITGQTVSTLAHDSSTLGGNSGSAVISVKTGEAVSLHFAGEYLKSNYSVSMLDLAEDSRVRDAGVVFGGRPEPRHDFYGPLWTQADSGQEGPPRGTKPTAASPGSPDVPNSPNQFSMNAEVANWTIPLNVSVTIGTPNRISELPPSRGGSPIATPMDNPPKPDVETSSAEENWFRRFKVEDHYGRFSVDSLKHAQPDWNAALSTSLASYLAYFSRDTIKKFLKNWGFTEYDMAFRNGTECFMAKTDQIALVSFRGTEFTRLSDWMTDLNAWSTPREYGDVHRGFLAGFQIVEDSVLQFLKQANVPVVLTGHSLGGALALVAAAEWAERDDIEIQSLYTFGQPAVGKGGFVKWVNQRFGSRFVRFVNDDDLVPKVPPTYKHVGRLVRFGYRGGISEAAEAIFRKSVGAQAVNGEADETTSTMSPQEFDKIRLSLLEERVRGPVVSAEEGLLPVPSFRDHKMAKYIRKIVEFSD